MKGNTIRLFRICLSKHKAAGRKGNQGAAEQPPAGASELFPQNRKGKKKQPYSCSYGLLLLVNKRLRELSPPVSFSAPGASGV